MKRVPLTVFVLIVFAGLVAGGKIAFDAFTFSREAEALATLQREIREAHQHKVTDPIPLAITLKAQPKLMQRLDSTHRALLVRVVMLGAQQRSKAIELALYQRDYRFAHGLIKEFEQLIPYGNREVLQALYRCLEQAYQDHPFLNPAENFDEIQRRWLAPPESASCSEQVRVD